jgi:type I restriction enzyme S subunit
MKSDWQEHKWGDLATLEYGKGLRGYQDGKERYPVYGTNGQIGWHIEPLCEYPSVIIGRKGAYRGIHYSPEPFYVIDTAFYLSPKTDFDLRWAYYQLLTVDINSMDSGSAIPSTSREDFYNLPVLVPPSPEQHAIAHILGTLDDKIELNRQMNATLEAIARAVFKSWFVDFDPVRANRGEIGLSLPSDILALFPDSFVESERGLIPAGWAVAPVKTLVSLKRDRINPTDFPDETFYYFSFPAYIVSLLSVVKQ